MNFSSGKSRSYQLSMAVFCTLLASGGFVGAGYVDTSAADVAAAALSAQEVMRTVDHRGVVTSAGLGSFVSAGSGVKISFPDALILAKKPAAEKIFDLTDPNGTTLHLSRSVSAMRGDIPEVSAELVSQVRKDILAAAYQGLGHPYVWGGTSFENGWDCSGFVQWAYGQAGVGLPRTEQWLPMVETDNPQPGDIVVQTPDGPNHWSHIGIYLGEGLMISALNPSVGTILHAPAATSSSSTYFTMPAFATADEKARAAAAKNKAKTDKNTSSAEASKSPSAKPSAKPSTNAPGTTGPATTPATTGPATTPATTGPATTGPGTTGPATTGPATTGPATTGPATTGPATTPSAGTASSTEATPAATTTSPSAGTARPLLEPSSNAPAPTRTTSTSAAAVQSQSTVTVLPTP